MSRKLKRVVLKEELVALTGDFIAALCLNQFLYWSERADDFDRFIKEERERDPDVSMPLTHGWIYKTADELHGELMISTSTSTLRRRLDLLVEKGWLDRRRNPHHKWDKTYQYRPNVRRIQRDLAAIDYVLADYSLEIRDDGSMPQDDASKLHGENSMRQGDRSTSHGEAAIPEITSETIPEMTSEIPPPPDSFSAANCSGDGGGDPSPSLIEYLASLTPPIEPEAASAFIGAHGESAVLATLKAVENDPNVRSVSAVLSYRLNHGWLEEPHEETMATDRDRASRWRPDAG